MAVSKKFWDAALVGVTVASIGVAGYGLWTSVKAAQRVEYYQQQCIRLHEENSTLRMKLVEMQPTT